MNIIISGFGCNNIYFTNFIKKIKYYELYHLNYDKNIQDYIHDLIIICLRYSKVNLIGFSMGCHVALLLQKHISNRLSKLILISPSNIFFWWPTTDCCIQLPKHFKPLKIHREQNIQMYIKYLHYVSKLKPIFYVMTNIYYIFHSLKAKEPKCLIDNMSKMNILKAWQQIYSIMIKLNFYELIRNTNFNKRILIITGTYDYNLEFCKLLTDTFNCDLKIIDGANHHMIYFESNLVYNYIERHLFDF